MEIVISPHRFSDNDLAADRVFVPLSIRSMRQYGAGKVTFLNPNPFEVMPSLVYNQPISQPSPDLLEFKRMYQHLSTNGYEFERMCMERFFWLRDYFESNAVERAVVCEVDVMLFTPLEDFLSRSASDGNKVMLSAKKCISLSVVTRDFLRKYCDLLLNTYSTSAKIGELKTWFEGYASAGNKGGVSDMTFCDWMAKGRGGFDASLIEDICSPVQRPNGFSCVDNFMSYSNLAGKAVVMSASPYGGGRLKQVSFVHGVPQVTLSDSSEKLDMTAIHFQGHAKALMGMAASFAALGGSGALN